MNIICRVILLIPIVFSATVFSQVETQPTHPKNKEQLSLWVQSDYQIVFQSSRHDGFASTIFAINTDGTDERRLSPYPEGSPALLDPSVSNDGATIIFTFRKNAFTPKTSVGMMNADGSGVRMLTDEIATRYMGGVMTPSMSPDGKLIVFVSNHLGKDEIFLTDTQGRAIRRMSQGPGKNTWPRWSPDGERILFVSTRHGNSEIYTMDKKGTNVTRITNHRAVDSQPAWSPDGVNIIFVSEREGNRDIFIKMGDGKGLLNVTRSPGAETFPSWSPDGNLIAYIAQPKSDVEDPKPSVFISPPKGRKRKLVSNPMYKDTMPSWIKSNLIETVRINEASKESAN